MVTIIFPLFSSLAATCYMNHISTVYSSKEKKKKRGPFFRGPELKTTFKQAATFAPEDIPTSNPSSVASLLALAMASSEVTATTSSMQDVSTFSGIKPAPIPWIL